MLFQEPLNSILGQSSKVKILRFLIRSQAELNGTQIAKAVGLSHVKSNIALQELVAHGLMTMRRVGRSCLYRLDQENIVIKKLLRPLFEKEYHLSDELKKIITGELKPAYPLSIVLFGSIVRGDARPNSDIDLLVVIPQDKNMAQAKREIERAGEKVLKIFGNHLSPLVVKVDLFCKKYRRGEKLYVDVVKNGKPIYGKSLQGVISVRRKD